jgi:HPt (histidine-containing phosphotransfer) domain-containing protein
MAPFVFNPKLDHAFLNEMYENDIAYAEEVFSAFLEQTKNEFKQVKNCSAGNDWQCVRQKLHKIKPTFSFVGLTALSEKCEEVISACDNKTDLQSLTPMWLMLEQEIEQSFSTVEAELVRMKTYIL